MSDSTTTNRTSVIEAMSEVMSDHLHEWLAAGERGNIAQIESKMRQLLQEVGASALSRTLNQLDAGQPEPVACPCGEEATYLMRREAKTLTVFGWVSWRRAYHRCPACRRGQCPLDGKLRLAPGQVSAGLGPLLALLGIEESFDEAKCLARELLLLEVSDNTIRKETQRMGQLQIEREAVWREESQQWQALHEPGRRKQKPPHRLYGSIDGALAPIEKEWRELKLGCWYEVEAVSERQWPSRFKERLGQLEGLRAKGVTYYCDTGQAEAFAELAWATGCQRLADRACELVFVCDGARWIWKLVSENFPDAIQIVDWFHAVAYLMPIAEGLCQTKAEREAWCEQMKAHLWHSRTEAVIDACWALASHPQAGEVARAAAIYYENNQARLDYARFRQAGYLIGSGVIESGCKQINSQRLKRAGAQWTKAGARATAKARAAWLSGEWDALAQRRSLLPLAV